MRLLQRWLPDWLSPAAGSAGAALAVYLSSNSMAVARAAPRSAGLCVDLRADPLPSLEAMAALLRQQCRGIGAGRGARCTLVLAPELYSLALLERPEVPEEELRDAVRWRLQEALDYPVDQASLDVFPLPESADRGRPMVFVVALRTEMLKRLIDGCLAADLTVRAVDVTELALRNLVYACHPEPDRGVGLLRLTGSSGVITLSRGEELFLSRRMQRLPGAFDAALWESYQEPLLLQVQRSIDYYESAMGQPPCSGLILAAPEDWQAPISDYLAEMLPVPNRAVVGELGNLLALRLHNPEPHDIAWDELQGGDWSAVTAALPALGGLLRDTPFLADEEQVA